MNTNRILKPFAYIALISALTLSVKAQEEDMTPSASASKPALSPVMTELQDIMMGVRRVLKENNGSVTAEDLAPSLKKIDELIAKHPEKNEEMAEVMFAKVMIYAQVLNDEKKSEEIMKQLKTDYKGTKLVTQIEKQEAAQE